MGINMSYCRFENTLAALRECNAVLSDSRDPISDLSDSERKAARKLFKLCRDLADDFESEIMTINGADA